MDGAPGSRRAGPGGSLFAEGRNCWRTVRADRLAFLIDAAAYYAAVAAALEQARTQVLVLGWDFDARIALRRDDGPRDPLDGLLRRLVRRRRRLRVHVLEWDFLLLHGLRGHPIPFLSRPAPVHRRIRIRHDTAHPVGASHHQKVVVIDDAVAFVGGCDLTARRWDTPEHRPDDPRRVDPGGDPYRPFHDVQAAVSGNAAACLGELARDRWYRATGRRLAAPRSPLAVWPAGVPSDLEDVDVAIARTAPALDGRPEVREAERLFLETIRTARRWIYAESQYLTSAAIADALAARLAEDDGPEIVIVLTRDSSGWLEQSTMDVLRTRVLRRLRGQDPHGRLRVYHPVAAGDAGEADVYVHAKVMVADDALARVGSANLSNRSMGFDTECDLAVEARGDPRREAAVGGLRDRLVGEHLGVAPRAVRERLDATGSLIETIESLRTAGRRLEPLDREAPGWLLEALPDRAVTDPERPIAPEQWLDDYLPRESRRLSRVNRLLLATIGLLSVGLVVAHGLTALGDWMRPETIRAALGWDAWAVVAVAYAAGAVLLVPATLLIVATVLVYGSVEGFLYALLGLGVHSVVGYVLGRLLPRDTVRYLARSPLNPAGARLRRPGLVPVLLLRLLPAVSFGLGNLVAGAARARLGDFVLGSILGAAPWLLAATLVVDRLTAVLHAPSVPGVALLAFVGAVVGAGAAGLLRWLRDWRPHRRTAGGEGAGPATPGGH